MDDIALFDQLHTFGRFHPQTLGEIEAVARLVARGDLIQIADTVQGGSNPYDLYAMTAQGQRHFDEIRRAEGRQF